MAKQMAIRGIIGVVCFAVGTLFTAVMTAFLCDGKIVPVDIIMAMGCCIGWIMLGFGSLGMWYGYTLANKQALQPIQSAQNVRAMLSVTALCIPAFLVMGPGMWLTHYRAAFTWWFVMAHLCGVVLFMAFAALNAVVQVLRTAPIKP